MTGINDLDKINQLKAINPAQLTSDNTARLLKAVNETLMRIHKKSILCMFASGLVRGNFFDVKLPLRRSSFLNDIPPHYIAVNPRNEIIKELAILFQKNSQLAIHRTIQLILSESELYSGKENIIIKKTAKILLSEI
jgi:hypothetical protein